MPGNGWKVRTVRENTAERMRELAREKSLSIGEIVKSLPNRPPREGWVVCEECEAKLKAGNHTEHALGVHNKLIIE